MKRVAVQPRNDWKRKVEAVGFKFHSANESEIDPTYWDERVAYQFQSKEIDRIEEASQVLYQMCLSGVDHVVRNKLFARMGIPEEWGTTITRSWERQDLDLYGRFDLMMSPEGHPKMLEFNADTPTSLYEAAVIQWAWLEDQIAITGNSKWDQFNSLHDQLIEAWRHIGERLLGSGETLYLSHLKDVEEDATTVWYLQDCAMNAGLRTDTIAIEDIGWNGNVFADLKENAIRTVFKLYPWEWMIQEDFGKHIRSEPWDMIEPAWKMVLSNKAIMPILWEMFPDHDLLLPSYFDKARLGNTYVQKPFFSREGANVTVVRDGVETLHQDLGYGGEGQYIYQKLQESETFDGNRPVLGSWIIAGRAAGMGIREDIREVTGNQSRFVPHYFTDN